MKQNGNYERQGSYYLGLDVGTNSVGWAVTDPDYRVLKCKGKAMWGVRLFEEAKDASERRSSRTNRRRLSRQKQRLLLLRMLFAEELNKVDPNFLIRMQESALLPEDKAVRYALFADDHYSDREYHKAYPTAYHLRLELMESDQPHDIRLVYLALHHIFKSRGHFLYDTGDDSGITTLETAFSDLCALLGEDFGTAFSCADEQAFLYLLQRSDLGVSAKKKSLSAMVEKPDEAAELSLKALAELLAGASVKLSVLFCDETLKESEIKAVSLSKNLDEQFDELSTVLGDRMEVILQAKTVFDAAKLAQILGAHHSLSAAKVALYEKNHRDLRLLKRYVRAAAPEQYRLIFSERKDKLNNYAAYSRYHESSGDYKCTQEAFCKFLKSRLPAPDGSDAELTRMFQEIQDGVFLSKLRGTDNGVVPYQLHRQELLRILDRASAYLPFLNDKDADGITVREKIEKTFAFRIPYYVGPLNSASPRHWAVRFAGKEQEQVRPWNFETVVDTESSAAAFMDNLIGRCTYTGEKVLPKDSLLYSEYMLLNEINPLRVNGHPLLPDVKRGMLDALFYQSARRVRKSHIQKYLLSVGAITREDEITGVDDAIKTTLKSYHDFREILTRVGDYDMVEQIIRAVLVFGEDKAMLRRWLRRNTHDLTEQDYKQICRLKYSEWGRLSETFLTGIKSPDGTGAEKTVMDLLRATDKNLMQLLSSDYAFADRAEEHRSALLGNQRSLSEKLDELYVAPAVRRAIRQTLRIVDEIVDTQKSVPAKIFIEMARGDRNAVKKQRTESRKDKLLALYRACGEESNALFQKLQNEDENRLRGDKLFLYYTQLGKCMYSGEPIDLDALLRGERYDIDHIFPRSRVKDNSLDNRVLVRNELNREKTNIYPIKAEIQSDQKPFWSYLKKAGLISEKKYDRLTRREPLTDQELSAFVARQLVETQQSTKALTVLLRDLFGDHSRIVFSKAGNVSDFRHDFKMIKCREINDLHHAKDAYLNIVVGNVYCTKFTDRFFANIRNEKYSLNCVFDDNVPGAWDKKQSIAAVRRQMAKNNVMVTRMPYETKGALFDLQLVPAGKGQLPKKSELDIEKYGGYNKLTGAYFCAVEYTEKKKRVRSLLPVYVYQKVLFETDPLRYCKEALGLEEPKVIVSKIRTDAMLELDGKRLLISSRTGNRIIYKHSYQLIMDSTHEKYVRALQKYVERCDAQQKELPVTEFDEISSTGNMEFYSWFCKKCEQKVYVDYLKNMKADMEEAKPVFDSFGVLDQGKILLEILKAFRCNVQTPNFKQLNGKGVVARVNLSNKVSAFSSAFLIHQSVTGLYEYKTDLLK